MLKRLIIISSGAGLAGFCVATAVLTLFGKNPATLHLTKFFLIGYAAITAVLTPFGISGIIGGFSRKKALIRAFVTIQWWLATFIIIALNVFNVILSKRNKGDFIRRCQTNLAKGQPEADFLARCTAIAKDAENATFIATCSVSGSLLVLGILLLIVGTREYSSIRSEEEVKSLLEKSGSVDKLDTSGESLSPETTNTSSNDDGGANDTFVPVPYDLGRYPPTNMTNVKLQPSNSIKVVTTNVGLNRLPTNAGTTNSPQYSGLRRHPTDPRNQDFVPPSYQGLTRNPTIPANIPPKMLTRYPTNGFANNVINQPTIGNAYPPRNYVGAPQATYPMAPQRSLSTKQYINPPQPSYVTQIIIPPPQPTISEVENDYSKDYYVRKPYKTTTPYLTRTGMN